MFNKETGQMTLTSEIADRLFNNINASSYGNDQTFSATLRAVLHSRLPKEQSVNLVLVPLNSSEMYPDVIAEKVRQNDFGHSFSIYIVYAPGISGKLLDIARDNFGSSKMQFKDFVCHEDLRVFYIKMLEGLFYRDFRNQYDF